MSTEENKARVDRFNEEHNKGNLAALVAALEAIPFK
jgi:hypothetical protein